MGQGRRSEAMIVDCRSDNTTLAKGLGFTRRFDQEGWETARTNGELMDVE